MCSYRYCINLRGLGERDNWRVYPDQSSLAADGAKPRNSRTGGLSLVKGTFTFQSVPAMSSFWFGTGVDSRHDGLT